MTPTPWSDTNAQYRANVLLLLQELGKLGPQATIYNNLGLFAWWEDKPRAATRRSPFAALAPV